MPEGFGIFRLKIVMKIVDETEKKHHYYIMKIAHAKDINEWNGVYHEHT